MKHIAVIGTGYAGLVAGTIFASVGNKVTCVDNNPERINTLLKGHIPIYEPGLAEILQQVVKEGNLHFTQDLSSAVKNAEIIFLAVGTPSTPQGAYDGSYVMNATHEIGEALRHQPGYRILAIKSTITPEMFHEVEKILQKILKEDAHRVDVISNPEFLAEGTAVQDFLHPDRVIIGCTTQQAKQIMFDLYKAFIKIETSKIRFMRPASAIVAKLGANGMLASRVAYMNELAEYSDKMGADIEEVRMAIGSDIRIGEKFLYPGPGIGGSCFGKDLRGLRESAATQGLKLHIISAIETSNNIHKQYLPSLVKKHYGDLHNKVFAIWGLAFKARTDDMRESPAVDAIKYLLAKGAKLRVHDPQAMENARHVFGDTVEYCEDKYAALDGASGVLIITEWNIYKNPDPAELLKRMKHPILFDGRNLIVDPRDLIKQGIVYIGMGRNGVFDKVL